MASQTQVAIATQARNSHQGSGLISRLFHARFSSNTSTETANVAAMNGFAPPGQLHNTALRKIQITPFCFAYLDMPIPAVYQEEYNSHYPSLWHEFTIWVPTRFRKLRLSMVEDRSGRIGPCVVVLCYDERLCSTEQKTNALRKTITKAFGRQESMQKTTASGTLWPFPYLVFVDKSMEYAGGATTSDGLLHFEAFLPVSCLSLVGLRIRTKGEPSVSASTLGGVIYIDGKAYGLAAMHAFDSPFAEGGSLERLYDYCSQSSSESPASDDDNEESGDLFADEKWRHLDTIQATALTSELPPEEATNTMTVDASSPPFSPPGSWKPLGQAGPRCQSRPNDTEGFVADWLLVDLDEGIEIRRNAYLRPGNSTLVKLKDYAKSIPDLGTLVHVISGVSGFQHAMLGQRDIPMMIGRSQIQITEIFLDWPLAKGDSGAWVVQEDTILGFVVAGQVETPLAYMISMSSAVDSIRSQLGTDSVCFTEETNTTTLAAASTHAVALLPSTDLGGGDENDFDRRRRPTQYAVSPVEAQDNKMHPSDEDAHHPHPLEAAKLPDASVELSHFISPVVDQPSRSVGGPSKADAVLATISSNEALQQQPVVRGPTDPTLEVKQASDSSYLIPVQTDFKFQQLAEDEIRLFRLRPNNDDDPLQGFLYTCRMHELSGSKTQSERSNETLELREYDAISYCWDYDSPPADVMVYSTYASGKIRISASLEIALKNIRASQGKDEELYLWVDRLCVNFEDCTEMSFRVANMSDIFQRARKVRISLGSATKTSDTAMGLVKELATFENLSGLTSDPSAASRWVALRDLMLRPWFQRRWIVQEIADARDAEIACGNKLVTWSDFMVAVELFGHFAPKLGKLFNHAKEFHYDREYLGSINAMGAKTLVNLLSLLFRLSEDGETVDRLFSIDALVLSLSIFETKDPRDFVYAGLSLSRQTSGETIVDDSHVYLKSSPEPTSLKPLHLSAPKAPPIRRDYNLPAVEVCKDLVNYSIHESRSLDIICRPWAPVLSDLSQALPSWIPNVSHRPFELSPSTNGYERVAADVLVGDPVLRPTTYQASGALRPSASIRGNSLRAKGFLVDSIAVKESSMESIVPATWKMLCDWKDTTKPPPDRFWRTLVADCGVDGQSRPPRYWERACQYLYSITPPRKNLNIDKLLSTLEESSALEPILRRVRAVTWNRAMALTKGNGAKARTFTNGRPDPRSLVALVSPEAQVGDLICILHGCSVPVVLRQKTNAGWEGELADGYRLIFEDQLQSVVYENEDAPDTISRVVTEPTEPPQVSDIQRGSVITSGISAEAMTSPDRGRPSLRRPSFALGAPTEGSPLGTIAQSSGNFLVPPNVPSTEPKAINPSSPRARFKGVVQKVLVRLVVVKALKTLLDRHPERYILIGECYVYGMMHGEAFEYREKTGNPVRDFILV